MIIGFVGKGGSGKSTLTALHASHLASLGKKVLVIDADVNMHAGLSLGLSQEDQRKTPSLGAVSELMKEYLRGKNIRITRPAHMIKSTPPGEGSMRLSVHDTSPLAAATMSDIDGIKVAYAGEVADEDAGVSCFHKYTGAVQLMLNHYRENDDEYILLDMTAGTDAIGGGLFAPLDFAYLVVEPTLRSTAVFHQFADAAASQGVAVYAVGNKVDGDEDVEFLKGELGDALVATMPLSKHVRNFERGVVPGLSAPLAEDDLRSALVSLHAHHGSVPDRMQRARNIRTLHERVAPLMKAQQPEVDWFGQIDPDYGVSRS